MGMSGNDSSAYTSRTLDRVKATALTVAQALGDTIVSDAVIVGGLVPTLLYQDAEHAQEFGAHVGTQDLDLTLDLAILGEERYEHIQGGLRANGFKPDEKEDGAIKRQSWRSDNGVILDLLMPPVPPNVEGGVLQSLTTAMAAMTMRGLDLALAHRRIISLTGVDTRGRSVKRDLPVCSASVFLMLKALALAGRSKDKDAYDLHYVLVTDPLGPERLGADLRTYASHAAIGSAVASLRRDYASIDGRGPKDVCSFLGRTDDEELAGSAFAHVKAFLIAFPE